MAVTVQQEVAALYSAIFNRAPDQAGLQFWVNAIEGGNSLAQAAEGFTAHPVFAETYAGLTNIQFVQQLYINVLGSAGDAKGNQFWANKLASGVSQGQMVAEFVQGALSIDLDALLASGELSQADYDAAVVRQDSLTNKANVGVYFAETFGAASNLNPATDTTTAAGLAADPAYLASQAAIANVTNVAATVTAAQGRIDVAVATNDPAGSLVGQNSELTAALVALQDAQVAQAEALEALALAVNAAEDTPLTGAALEAFVSSFGDTQADNAFLAAQNGVPAAQAAVAAANVALNNARASSSDAALNAAVVTATNNVNADPAAKALFDTLKSADAALASNIAGAGTDQALLAGIRDALTGYIAAGNPTSTVIEAGGGSETVASLLDTVTAVLTATYADAAAAAAAYKTAVGNYADTYSVTNAGATATAAESALTKAIAAIDQRDDLYSAQDDAKVAFGGNTLGGALVSAQEAVATRGNLIEAVADAQEGVAEAQEYLASLTGLYNTYTATEDAEAAALASIEALDVNLNLTLAGTSDNDLFIADLSDATNDYSLTAFGVAGDDQLFIGTGFQFGGATSDTVTTQQQLFAGGNSNVLEVFFEQLGSDAIVHIETKAFANAAASPANDIVSITLTGVSVDDLSFENGFVVHA